MHFSPNLKLGSPAPVDMISHNQIREIVDRIVRNVRPERVILFGSYAYGHPTEDSDLDILVIKNMEGPRHQRVKEVKRHLRGTKIPIDVVVYTEDEIEKWKETSGAFITRIMKKGKVLYG